MSQLSIKYKTPRNGSIAIPNQHYFFQPKLTINQPNDVYEQEADAVADDVMRMNNGAAGNLFFKPAVTPIQRKCAECEKEEQQQVQRKESSPGKPTSTENYLGSLSGGQPLSQGERHFFEAKMEHDFSDVRLHTDSKAAESAKGINALAYTHSNNIVFAANQYQPESESGKRLLAHELTHVVQQRSDSQVAAKIQRQPDFLRNLDPSCQVDWQAVWEGRFDLGRDLSCGAKTPLGRINTSDIYAAYRYLFGNRPPDTPAPGNPCPADRRIPWGGCCPANTAYDPDSLRCAESSVDITTLPCPPGWARGTLGLCAPPLPAVPPAPGPTLPGADFPRLPRFQGFGTITSTTIDHFAFDSSAVPSGHEAELDHLVALLNVYSDVNIHIDGHTDSEGDPGYNRTLSQQRADAIKAELLNRGVQDESRIVTQPYGESRLLISAETNDEDRARNRRVEVWYIVPPATNPLLLNTPTLNLGE